MGHLKNGINGSTENTQCLIIQFNTCYVVYFCFCPYIFLAGILRNNNYGDHVPAWNQSALMLPLIFKTMLQHTEYLYTYKKSYFCFFSCYFQFFRTNLCHQTSTETKSCSKVPGLLPFYCKF